MKTLLKNLSIILFLAGMHSAHAQSIGAAAPAGEKVIYSVALDAGSATGNFNDSHRYSLGGSLQADIPLVKNLYATVNAGYQNFFGRSNINGTMLSASDLHLLPVKAGIKVFPFSILYIQGEAGAAFALNKSDLNYEKSAAFIFAPQVGLQLPVGGSNNYLDLGFRYENSTRFTSNIDRSKLNYVGLRLAYAFSSK